MKKLPFYHTRKFWGVVLSSFFVWAIGYYFLMTHNSMHSISDAFTQFSFSIGALPIIILFDGILGETISYIAFYSLLLSLLYKTFNKKMVSLKYPILLLIILISGHVTKVLLSGLI